MDLFFTGTVYLDVHAAASKTTQQDAILLTAAHELTHHIRLNAEAQYDALKEFVIEHLLEQGQDFETMLQDKLKEKGMKRSDAVEEVVADACEMVLKDSKAVEKLAKENKSLAQTIADWLHGFYEDIKAAFEGVEARSKEAKAMTDYMDELVKLWDDALIEASKGESKQSGWIRFSKRSATASKEDPETTAIKEQIASKREELNKMELVASATVPTDLGGFDEIAAWAMQVLKKTGYQVDKQGFGRVLFDEKQIRNGIKYAKTQPKKAAFAVLDKVIKRGIEIGSHGDHKHREKETITFAAPVELNGIRGNMAVVINKRGNTYYAHRIVLPDGSVFKFAEKNTAAQGPKRGVTQKSSLAESTSATADVNVAQNDTKVNYSRRDSSEGLTKEEARAQAQAYTRLKAENAALQRRLEYWQGQTRRTKQRTINRGDVDKYARQLIKMHGSTIDPDWLKQKLREMGDYLVQTDELDYSVLNQMAWEISSAVIENAEAEDDSAAYDVPQRLQGHYLPSEWIR